MENRGLIIGVAIAIFVCVLVAYLFLLGASVYLRNYCFSSRCIFGYAVLSYVIYFVLGIAKTSVHFYPNKRYLAQKAESNGFKLSVFKGREAILNRAIFAILAIEGPKTIIDLQKQLRKQKDLEGTYYASVNKRIHCLEKTGYITPKSTKTPQLGSKARQYKLCTKAYLAIFINKKGPEDLLNKVTDKDATIILSDLVNAFLPNNKECKPIA